MPEDWRSAVNVPLYKGKGEKTECKNYRGISLLREGACRSDLYTRKHERKNRAYVGFIDLDKV